MSYTSPNHKPYIVFLHLSIQLGQHSDTKNASANHLPLTIMWNLYKSIWMNNAFPIFKRPGTCLRNTWQYCPPNPGPLTDKHSCREPTRFTFPPSTSLPIFPNASYTDQTTRGMIFHSPYASRSFMKSLMSLASISLRYVLHNRFKELLSFC